MAILAGVFIAWRDRARDREQDEIAERALRHQMKPAPAAAPSSTPSHVRKLSKEDRAKLAEQIHASLAQRASANAATNGASGSPGSNVAPSLDEPLLTLEDVGPELKSALDESVSILGECYEQHPESTVVGSGSDKSRTALAMMVMTTDPDFGTIVDSDKLTDADGTPLDPALEGCLRDTIQSLALPPLGKPGKLPLQYTFRSDDKK
ncbi:MAG TPA: hypothetical protein VGM90_12480 [Kofleriaceae bacterium]